MAGDLGRPVADTTVEAALDQVILSVESMLVFLP